VSVRVGFAYGDGVALTAYREDSGGAIIRNRAQPGLGHSGLMQREVLILLKKDSSRSFRRLVPREVCVAKAELVQLHSGPLGLAYPPRSPKECIFARTTGIISADFRTRVNPCQFGGDPDFERCGCIASMGLAAVGHHRVFRQLTAGHLFMASDRLGKGWRSLRKAFSRKSRVQAKLSPFNNLELYG
jgi:hypothetical protein